VKLPVSTKSATRSMNSGAAKMRTEAGIALVRTAHHEGDTDERGDFLNVNH